MSRKRNIIARKKKIEYVSLFLINLIIEKVKIDMAVSNPVNIDVLTYDP